MATLWTSIKLPIQVDCIEFCPTSGFGGLLACGLYQLQSSNEEHASETNQTRIGGVQIVRCYNSFCQSDGFQDFASYRIDAGVLALRWISDQDLICACSDSKIRFLKLDRSEKKLYCAQDISIPASSGIILNVELDSSRSSFAIGDSTGHVAFGNLDRPDLSNSWNAHGQSEVWCVDFHRGEPNLLLSGADDGLLKVWDRRVVTSEQTAASSIRHDAGVISILSTFDPNKVWTGSYDDHLRLWDLRAGKTPLQSLNLGGGVWRIKPKGRYLLCACMYNGWCIVDCKGWCSEPALTGNVQDLSIKISDSSFGAELLYGVDWVPMGDDIPVCSSVLASGLFQGMDWTRKDIVVCSTFYDSTVRSYNL